MAISNLLASGIRSPDVVGSFRAGGREASKARVNRLAETLTRKKLATFETEQQSRKDAAAKKDLAGAQQWIESQTDPVAAYKQALPALQKSHPDTQFDINYNPSQFGFGFAPAAKKDFTLDAGQQRFSPEGALIATGAKKPPGDRQIKINALIDRGLSQNDASDVVEGRVKVTSPDDFGNIYSVNLTDGSKTLIVSGQGQDVTEQAEAAPISQDNQLIPLEQAIEEGTGPGASGRAFINSVIGPFVEGQPYPDTSKSRAAINLFNQEAKTSLVNNPRFPVAEQKIMQALLPDTKRIFTDPDGEREKAKQLRIFLRNKKQQNMVAISSGKITEKEVGRLSNQNASIERTIALMGEESATAQPIAVNPETGERIQFNPDTNAWEPI